MNPARALEELAPGLFPKETIDALAAYCDELVDNPRKEQGAMTPEDVKEWVDRATIENLKLEGELIKSKQLVEDFEKQYAQDQETIERLTKELGRLTKERDDLLEISDRRLVSKEVRTGELAVKQTFSNDHVDEVLKLKEDLRLTKTERDTHARNAKTLRTAINERNARISALTAEETRDKQTIAAMGAEIGKLRDQLDECLKAHAAKRVPHQGFDS